MMKAHLKCLVRTESALVSISGSFDQLLAHYVLRRAFSPDEYDVHAEVSDHQMGRW